MPIHRGRDSKGPFYQWGSQTKYYYIANNAKSREQAYEKARRQEAAIYSSGYQNLQRSQYQNLQRSQYQKSSKNQE
jgi:hypothetical protein